MIPFLTPRYLKEGRELHKAASRMLESKRDLLKPEEITRLQSEIDLLGTHLKARNPTGIQASATTLDTEFNRYFPPKPMAWWRDNFEALLVAIVIAVGIRTYFIQPFTIPTGSMQPTLNGVIAVTSEEPPPGAFQQAIDAVRFGRSYVDLVAKTDGEVQEIREFKRFRFFTYSEIVSEQERFTVQMPARKLREFGIFPGMKFEKGDILARGHVDTGDHVFVDKFTYHFRQPKRGEIFVFNTANIPMLTRPGEPSQYYIKRLAGTPGDALRIASPDLYINGALASEPGFLRVMSEKDGYRGYANAKIHGQPSPYLGTPTDTFTVGEKQYFALGDNSYDSLDSRSWGTVPEQNLTGRGLLVFWPFTSHWGLMK